MKTLRRRCATAPRAALFPNYFGQTCFYACCFCATNTCWRIKNNFQNSLRSSPRLWWSLAGSQARRHPAVEECRRWTQDERCLWAGCPWQALKWQPKAVFSCYTRHTWVTANLWPSNDWGIISTVTLLARSANVTRSVKIWQSYHQK